VNKKNAQHECVCCGGRVMSRAQRCVSCARDKERARNRLPKKQAYADPTYKDAPNEGICWVCGRPTNGFGTRDHVVELAVGLSRGMTIAQLNDRSNLRVAHSWCNSRRSAGVRSVPRGMVRCVGDAGTA
jgi:hypothetical protein